MRDHFKQNIELTFHPVTTQNWHGFEKLFDEKGACGSCWCMWLRLKRSEFEAQKGEGNRLAMKKLVESGKSPGILAYHGGEPVAWCSIAPREEFTALARSRILKPIDDQPAWSIVCFFVAKPYRRKGITPKLIEAAVEFAKQHGATLVEGYPVDPVNDSYSEVFACPGFFGVSEIGFCRVRTPLRNQADHAVCILMIKT